MAILISKETADVLLNVAESNKVLAIKALRHLTKEGLKETKDAIECEFTVGPILIGNSRDTLAEHYINVITEQAKMFERMLDMMEDT